MMFTKKDLIQTIFRMTKDRFGAFRSMNKATTFEELEFDKYDILYMVMACEEYFKINISADEVAVLKDIRSLMQLVMKKLSELGTLTDEKTKQAVNAVTEPMETAPAETTETTPSEETPVTESEEPSEGNE